MELLKAFNKEQIDIIYYLKQICEKLNIEAYIVGGSVRDAYISKDINDIDICMTEDPKFIIKHMNDIKKCEYHQQFQTAAISFNNGVNIDLIRCRKELYEEDGKLPIVTPSNLYDDLCRRDFTVNALAYSIISNNIVDFHHGITDLKEKKLKSIHKRSYREDPTRIFRAVKYSVRYGFEICDKKEIKEDIKKGVLSTISNDRIIKEIYLMCMEKNWVDNFKACNELNILSFNDKYLGMPSVVEDFSDFNIRLVNVYFSLYENRFMEYFINNSFLAKDLKKDLEYYYSNKEKIIDLLLSTVDNYEIYRVLNNIGYYGCILLAWNKLLKYKIINYLYTLRHIKLSMNGKEIKSYGISEGKIIGKILNYMLMLKLNAGITDDKKYLENNLGEIIKCL